LIACVLIAATLGLLAGLAPGPYTTMVAATGLERGFRAAVPIALAPLVTDVPPMVVATFVVRTLNWPALTLLGLAGGVLIAMVGVRFLRAHSIPGMPPTAGERPSGARQSVRLAHVLTANLLNPAPWVFWFVLAGPLLLVQLRAGWLRGAAFVVVLFGVNILSASSLAWLASHGRRAMAPVNQRRVLVAVGITLACAGVFMVWQALEGNFQALIDRQAAVRGVLTR
jgi:threonine/homoserine/homoserine lactone efflux protein